MKALCSQEVVSSYLCRVVPCQVTVKASASQVPWFVLCVWLEKGMREEIIWFQSIDLDVLSRGSFRKTAYNLIETAQRKSQAIRYLLLRI